MLSVDATTNVIGRLPSAPFVLRSGGMAAHTLCPPSGRQSPKTAQKVSAFQVSKMRYTPEPVHNDKA